MVCPKCRQDVPPQKLGFTWWGGFVGAKLINHVECPLCHARFNGKTGQSSDTNIVIYMVVTSLFVVALYFAVTSMMK